MILQIALGQQIRVELRGLEPLTPTLPVWCATSCATAPGRAPDSADRGSIVHARRLANCSARKPRECDRRQPKLRHFGHYAARRDPKFQETRAVDHTGRRYVP